MTPEGPGIGYREDKTVSQVVGGGGTSVPLSEVAFLANYALSQPMGKGFFSVRPDGGATVGEYSFPHGSLGAGSGEPGQFEPETRWQQWAVEVPVRGRFG